jgi:transposase InsO family protein
MSYLNKRPPPKLLGRSGVHLLEWRVIRLAFIIDAFDREIIAWTAVAKAGSPALRDRQQHRDRQITGFGRSDP